MFAKDEVAFYHDQDEALDKLEYYGSHPEARQTLTVRARDRVLAEHTFSHRVQTLLEHLRAVFF